MTRWIMPKLPEEVKEKLRQIEKIDQERLRLLKVRQKLQREIEVLEYTQNQAEAQA